MEPISLLPKYITKFIYNVFSKYSETKKEHKEKFATLIDQISICVGNIGRAIEEKRHPVSECSELYVYLEKMELLATDISDKDTAAKLLFWLEHVEAVPGLAKIDLMDTFLQQSKPARMNFNRYEQAMKVQEISGALKGIANLLRI